MAGTRKLQDTFLERASTELKGVAVFLTGGVRLRGFIAAEDTYTLLLVKDGAASLVYKHAIATIVPDQPLTLYAREQAVGT